MCVMLHIFLQIKNIFLDWRVNKMYSKHIFIHVNTTGSALYNNTNTMYTSIHSHGENISFALELQFA